METAPLTLAHAHARNASAETWKANSSQASDEHQQAAGEFAKAARGTGDAEALRILRLLESHHHRLASIIKCSATPAAPAQPEHATGPRSPESAASAAASSPARPTSPRRTPQSPPRSTPRRKPPRDLSSSIASNLASARGIPGSQRRPAAPAISAQHVDGRILNRADRSTPPDLRRDGPQQAAKLSTDTGALAQVSDEKEQASNMAMPSSTDEGFKRFFSTFETFYSALSAPLAFAGLPLMTEESSQNAPQKPATKPAPPSTNTSASVRADSTPDPSSLFSKATLRALDTTPGAAESFIVVPTTGGTVSYAGILSHSGDKGHGVPSPIIEEVERSFDGEEFVDANEEPAPPSPTASRTNRRARPGSAGSLAAALEFSKAIGAAGAGGNRKTMEELELENGMMRQLLDKLSKRLHMWEASSQSQSLALAQSFRAHRPQATTPGGGSAPQTPGEVAVQTNMEQRLRELEILVESVAREKELVERENEKVVRENEKLLSVLGRYREKWEVLKAGARGRRERGAAGNGSGAEAGGEASGVAEAGVA